MRLPERLRPITDFTIHVITGGLGFIVILLVCVAINVVVTLLEAAHIVPAWAVTGADYVERALFTVDVFCFSAFTLYEVLHLIRGLWRTK